MYIKWVQVSLRSSLNNSGNFNEASKRKPPHRKYVYYVQAEEAFEVSFVIELKKIGWKKTGSRLLQCYTMLLATRKVKKNVNHLQEVRSSWVWKSNDTFCVPSTVNAP